MSADPKPYEPADWQWWLLLPLSAAVYVAGLCWGLVLLAIGRHPAQRGNAR